MIITKKDAIVTKKILLQSLCLISLLINYCTAQQAYANSGTGAFASNVNLTYPTLVNKFYELNQNRLKWFTADSDAHLLRQLLKNKIDSAYLIGLSKERYHPVEINKSIGQSFSDSDSISALVTDRIFTDAAIAYCKDLFQGKGIQQWMMYDEISSKYENQDNIFLLSKLADTQSAEDLSLFLNSLEPKDTAYAVIKNEFQNRKDSLSPLQEKQLSVSLNFQRWLHHFKFRKWIVVNIPSATLTYYEYDSIKLKMKVVVGKPSTKTPRFAAHCNGIILYPYWNVPTSIALNELLPKFKRNPSYVDDLNMQIIDVNGNIIDHHKLNWKLYNKGYFPFRIRQSTGCDNSLGVIKFNLTSPFSVYLHDTNYKGSFLLASRYLSHGCIRIEKPMELANYLLPQKIETRFLEDCLKDQVPVTLSLPDLVPVFVVYQTVETDIENQVKYYKDVYGLLK